ncbi:MAG: ATP-binding protein [Coriobacteriales bacterium]|jgi:two-component system phosphate regulon sensor histidine kinase PhoR
MSSGKFKSDSISSVITRTVLIVSTVLLVVFGIALTLVLYGETEKYTVEELESQSQILAESLNESLNASDGSDSAAVKALQDNTLIVSPGTRVSLISADGTVLYDNAVDVDLLDNHSMRPEFSEAEQAGESTTGRYSATLREETIYHAVRLDNGSVLRLAMTQTSATGFITSALGPIILIIIIGIVASIFIGRKVGKKVSHTLEDINLDEPTKNDAPKEIEPLLQRLDDQKRRLDAQDAERRRFTSNASHELKTPLTVISGYAEIISNGIAKPEDVSRFSGLIYDESKHMKQIVDDLLVLNRLDDAGADPGVVDMSEIVDLSAVVRSAYDRLSSTAEHRNITIELDIPDIDGRPPIEVRGNKRMLDEMVRNLLENAIKYNVEGGYVKVVVARDNRGSAIIRVEDTGIGIPRELRDKIFERFYSVDESRSRETGGSGLGLAIVKHAAQLHNAVITVNDNKPCGTIFEVTFEN